MTTRSLGCAAIAALATLATAAPAPAQPPSAASRLAAAADAVVAAGVPGIVVVSRDGARSTTIARGSDELATKRPMTAADRFRVGSVTKSFTATVVMQLVHEGRLGL